MVFRFYLHHKSETKNHICFVSLYFFILCERVASFLTNDYVQNVSNKDSNTLEFLNKHISTSETILDLGVENPFQKNERRRFSVTNTSGHLNEN
jgi:hypothetical protein